MITPTYSPTATERVLPRMALDFTTGVLDSRVTVTRALNTATRVNSSGYIETVNANLPRFDYDPITLAPKGLLIEESRTNLVPASSDFAGAFWERSGTATVTSDQVNGPDNTQTADLFRCGVTAASEVRRTGLSIAAGSNTFSVFVKKEFSNFVVLQFFDATTSSFQRVWFDLNAGTVGTSTSGGTNISLSSSKIEPYANGFYRCTISVSFTVLTLTGRTGIFVSETNGSLNGIASSGIYLWGADLEAGAFATSYIPTTTLAVLRNADDVTMTGTNFSSWYNASEGTLVGEFTNYPVVGSGKYAYGISDGSTTNFIAQRQDSARVQTLGSTVAAMNSATVLPNTTYKSVIAYKTDSFAADANAQLLYTDTAGGVPTVNQLMLGDLEPSTNRRINCWMRKFSYYPQRLINPEVTAFSK